MTAIPCFLRVMLVTETGPLSYSGGITRKECIAAQAQAFWACTTFLGSHFCLRLYKQMFNEVLVISASKTEWNPCLVTIHKSLPLLICLFNKQALQCTNTPNHIPYQVRWFY